MAKPSKRLFVVLSLCLLLQEFAPAYAADLPRARIRHQKTSHKHQERDNSEEESNDDQETQENPEARKIANKIFGTILKKGWKLLGNKNFIKRLNFVTEVTSSVTAATMIGLSVTKAIQGCTGIAPELQKNWDEYNKLDAKFREMSSQIDNLNLQAESRQIYINASFYEYRRTRDKLQEIANEKERVFNSFGPEVLVSAKNTTFRIEQLVKDKTAIGEQVNATTVYLGYKTGLDLTLSLLFPSLTLSFSGLKLFWKKYLRDTVIGKKISGLPDTIQSKIVEVTSKGGQTLGQRIKSSRIMNTRFGLGLQKIGSAIKPKLVKAAKIFKSIGKRLAPLLSLGGAAFGIWYIFQEVKQCTDMAVKSRESVTKMTELVNKTKLILANVTQANSDIQSGFDQINNNTFDPTILDAITQLSNMMSDSTVALQTEDSETIVAALQAYINGKDIKTVDDNSKIQINKLQRDLNEALHRIPFTLECYTIKGRTLTDVKTECAAGKGALPQVYETVKRLKGVDESNNKCTERTGELWVPLAKIRASWEAWVSQNKSYSKICLMNNNIVEEAVISQLQQGIKDPQTVANNVGHPDALDEITAMIDILKDDPKVNALPSERQSLICGFKKAKFQAAAALPIVNNGQTRKVTEEEYNNQICPESDGDADSEKTQSSEEGAEEGPSTVG